MNNKQGEYKGRVVFRIITLCIEVPLTLTACKLSIRGDRATYYICFVENSSDRISWFPFDKFISIHPVYLIKTILL